MNGGPLGIQCHYLDLNFKSGVRVTRMIYTIPFKFMFQSTKSNFYKPRSERKVRVLNEGQGPELLEGVFGRRSHLKWLL